MLGFCLDYRRLLRVFLLFLLLRRVLRLPPTVALGPFLLAFALAPALLVTALALTFLDTFADIVFVDGVDVLFGLDGPSPIVSILDNDFIN
jgi:hypothetical protein